MNEVAVQRTDEQKRLLFAEHLQLKQDILEYKRRHRREFTVGWYPWQLEAFRSFSSQIMTLAANRSVSPWTAIEMVGESLPVAELISKRAFDVQSWDGESRCVRPVSHVFLKGIAPMIRFQTDNGSFFDCTRNHRVLTQSGYLSASQLVWLLSGQNWSEIAVNSLVSYGVGANQYGLSLLDALDTYLSSLPSKDGVPSHILLERLQTGEKEQGLIYSRTLPVYDHPPTSDACHRLSALCDKWINPSSYIDAQPLIGVLPISQLPPTAAALRLQSCGEDDSRPDSDGPLLEGFLGDDYGSNSLEVLRVSPQGVSISQDEIALGELNPESLCDDKSEAMYNPLDSHMLVGGNRITSMIPIGLQPVFDLTVEDTHCYFAGGAIHKNSGKTMSAAFQTACDMTGDYPDWWEGFKQTHAPM